MNIRFYLDPETGSPHIYGHAVDEAEVKEVLRAPGEDRPGREGSIFVITAYQFTGKPLVAYR